MVSRDRSGAECRGLRGGDGEGFGLAGFPCRKQQGQSISGASPGDLGQLFTRQGLKDNEAALGPLQGPQRGLQGPEDQTLKSVNGIEEAAVANSYFLNTPSL